MSHAFSAGRRAARRSVGISIALALALALTAPDALAQTDYYNTDAGRPITTEDAYAIERRALEIQIAPLRLERRQGGVYEWGLEPEIAFGILPRTQVELAVPLVFADHGSARTAGVAGIHVSALHNLNTETSLPALAIAAEVLVPAGSLAPDDPYPAIKGIATKTFTFARVHANGSYTFGDASELALDDDAHASAELTRWMAALAVDRTFPLRSLLLTAELVARQPIVEQTAVEWSTGAGMRYQVGPRVAADAGAGYRLTGGDGWYVTFGAAVALGLPWSPRR